MYIPQMEHLCLQNAATWQNRPYGTCKLTSALMAKAYSDAGQTTSALHAMAILRSIRPKHEGSSEPGLI